MHKLAQAKRAMQMRPIVRERGVPRWLKRVLLRGLAPEPEARWPSMDPLLHELQQHPIRRTRRIAAVVGVVVVAASSSVVVAYRGDAAPEPCGGARERIQSVWNGQVREHVQAALLSTGRPYAADTVKKLFALVDGYADAWATTRTNTCRATMIHREQSETVMDRKMACLDDSLEQISAYFQALTEAPSDAALDRAAVEFQRMASLELCKDAEALARRDIPVAPTEVQAVDALGAATRRLHALMAATALEPLDAHIESIGKLLLGVSHAPTRAKALWALVAAYDMRGRADERDRSLSQLIDLAAQYDDKTLLSRAWSWRLWIVALEQRRMDVARELIRVAEAAATLARNEPEAAVIEDTVNITIASIEMAAGNLAAAEQRYQEVVARNLDLDPVSTNNNLSIVLVYRGKSAQAREALARAEKLLEGGGELAPPYGDIFMNRGLSYHWEGDLTSAETWYRKAVVLARQSMGDDNAKTWLYRLYLGHLLADVGRWHAADEELEQAATGFAAAYGAKFEFVIHARVQQARVALGLGEITGARTRIDAALSDLAATGTEQITCGYTHPLEVDGMIALAERNWNRAGESFRRAQETYRECYEAGSLRFVTPSIGLAKVDAGMGNLARARATIDEAMVMLREGGSTEHDLRLAEALELRAQLHDGGGSGPSSRDDLRHALRIWETSAPEHPHATALRERLSHNL